MLLIVYDPIAIAIAIDQRIVSCLRVMCHVHALHYVTFANFSLQTLTNPIRMHSQSQKTSVTRKPMRCLVSMMVTVGMEIVVLNSQGTIFPRPLRNLS